MCECEGCTSMRVSEMGVVGVFCHTGDTVRGKIEVPEGSYGSLGS